jgi:hypothetical protein
LTPSGSASSPVNTRTNPNLPPLAVDSGKDTQTRLVLPTNPRAKQAAKDALPNIKKILSVHRCVVDPGSLLLLRPYIMVGATNVWPYLYSAPVSRLRYHDKKKCLSVQAIDDWNMPALNALIFRAVFISDISGETIHYYYLMKKEDEQTWKLERASDSHIRG